MRVYKYYDAKYGRMALNESRLKLATIKDLNDPFEFRSPALKTSHDRKMFQNTIEKCMSSKGVLCFSKSRRNPVMWSHYADSHKGICLGFDVDDQCLSPVTYAGRRPRNEFRYDDIYCSENEQIFESCLLTKFSHWKYEKEMRAFFKIDEDEIRKAEFFFEPFSESIVLREVCLGIKYQKFDDALHNSMVSRGVAVRTMRMAFNEFAIVEQLDKKFQNRI